MSIISFLAQASLIGVYSLHMTTSYTMQVLTTVLQYNSTKAAQHSSTLSQYNDATIQATQFRCCRISSLHFILLLTSSFQIAIMAFFARVSDPMVGGTYMTFLNTVTQSS